MDSARLRNELQDLEAEATRGPPQYLNVNSWHLEQSGPDRRRRALNEKKKYIELQKGRRFVDHEIKRNSHAVRGGWVETKAALDQFATAALECLETEHTFIVLETFGNTQLWEEKSMASGSSRIENRAA